MCHDDNTRIMKKWFFVRKLLKFGGWFESGFRTGEVR